MKRHKRIYHRPHGHERKQPRRDPADAVAEVQQADGEAAEEDGEVQVGEEGPLVGEEDLGLDAGGEGDAFACGGGESVWGLREEDMGVNVTGGGLEKRLGGHCGWC
jgi:hypothetical protein